MTDVDLVAADAGRLPAAGGEGDDLGVGHRARRAHQLGSDLVCLAPLLESTLICG